MTFFLTQPAVGRNCSIGQLLIEVALSIAAVLAIAYVIRFVRQVRSLPPGPTPLPVLGNILHGRLVPKGCALFINVYAVNRDTNVWGPDAGTFNPKRFLGASAEQLSKGMNSFGTGPRSCPGEKMAQAGILYVIVRVLQRVRLSCPNGPGTADLESIDSGILLDVRRQDLIFELL